MLSGHSTCPDSATTYLQLLISADSEVALVLAILRPQSVDDLVQRSHVALPLVPLTSLFTVSTYLLVRRRYGLHP